MLLDVILNNRINEMNWGVDMTLSYFDLPQ